MFVHPTASPDPVAHRLGLPDGLIDFTADTTRAVAQMLYSNRLARTPSVKYILSHAGGGIPYLAGRFAIVDEMNVVRGGDIRGTVAQRPSVPGMSWASLRWCLARTIPISVATWGFGRRSTCGGQRRFRKPSGGRYFKEMLSGCSRA